MRLDVGSNIIKPTKGKIQFLTSSELSWDSNKEVEFDLVADNAYQEYTVAMDINPYWSGNVTRFRVYPTVDGYEGIKIHLKSIEVESRDVYGCDSVYGPVLCDRYSQYSHPCPWIGSPGKATSVMLDDGVTIVNEVNDKILVNIDSYGYQSIKLRPVVGARLIDIANDIQDKLNLIGVGGYAFARCYVEEYKLVIESDWNSSESQVTIKEPDEYSAGNTLGFFDSNGAAVYSFSVGTDSASLYERSSLQLSSSQIKYLKGLSDNGSKSVFSLDGAKYSVIGGDLNYRVSVKDNKLTFRNKTLIDYNNPINNNGIISFIGYSGDSFTNTSVKIFRQKLDGSIGLVHSVDFSSNDDDFDGIYEKSNLSLKVKKGDLIGIYSASLHTGNDYRVENYSYYLLSGEVEEVSSIPKLYGSGEKGFPIYVRSGTKANTARLDIEFEIPQLVESVVVEADETAVSEDLNLCTVRNGGLGGGPHLEGFTGNGEDGTTAPAMVNLSAVIDGEKQDINSTSEYCYPGWLDLLEIEQLNYQYTDFGLIFDFAKGVNVFFDIYKIKAYFNSNKNIKSFVWQVPIATNPEDTSRVWGEGWSEYLSVYTGDGPLDSSIYLYNNPSLLTAGNYQIGYSQLDYKYLELLFTPHKCRSLKFNATLGEDYNDDPLSLSYAKFPIAPDPRIQEIEVYSSSTPNKNISLNFFIETSKDGSVYIKHDDIDVLSSTKAKYTVGRPTRHLRLNMSIFSLLKINKIYGTLSEDTLTIDTNYKDIISLNAPVDDSSSESSTISITNDSSETSNFYIDIVDEDTKSERCILWNRLEDDTSLSNSEIGPGGLIRRRDYRNLRPYNQAYGCPGYYVDKNFMKGKTSYISLDNKISWNSIGSLITDGSTSSYVTNENALFHAYDTVYVALDLEDNYSIDSVDLFGVSGQLGFDSGVLYSSMDTSDPSLIPSSLSNPDSWSVFSKGNARWVLFSAPSVDVGGSPIRYLSYILVNIDIFSTVNKGKIPWTSANGYLTNGSAGYDSDLDSWIKDGVSKYFCVDLKWWYDVSNVITGPFSASISGINNTYSVSPGDWPSIVASNAAGANVAYSRSSTDDPGSVVWSNFGEAPDNPVRWVMVKTPTRVEEIIVHTYENEPNSKYSFINSGWVSTNGTGVYEEYAHTKSGVCAIAMDYPANGTISEFIKIKQNFGVDEEAAVRDALSFWVYISDVSQLDFSSGYFKLGKSITQDNYPNDINLVEDGYNYYKWPLSALESILLDGWNYITLPFSSTYKKGIFYLTSDDKTRKGTSDFSTRDRITSISFYFSPVENNDKFTVRLDDFRILRRYYSEGNFGYGVYVPYSEYVKFPLNDFNPNKGTIEFYLKPDWTKTFLCNSCNDPRDHTILRVFSSEDDSMFGIYMTGDGLKFYATDGEESAIVTDDTKYNIVSDTPTHVAFTWDFKDEYGGTPPMGIYINGHLSVNMEYGYLSDNSIEFNFTQKSLYTMLLGAIGWQGIISSFSSSADAVIENLKVHNYPITDFTYSINSGSNAQDKRSSEVIELSLDDVNYYGIKDRGAGLPLFKKNVLPSTKFNVFIRGKDWDETKIGERNRRPFISVTRSKA